ncbi:MAG: hypothetical protein QXK88_10610 [Desulfurococcaceae archaeon]
MAEVIRRLDITTTVLGGAILIGEKELRKLAPYYKNVYKFTRWFDDAVLPLVVGAIGVAIRQPLLQKMFVLGLMQAIKGAYDGFVAKEPFVYASDSSTIEVWNFDAGEVPRLVIDGSVVSVTATTDNTGYAKISLPSALSSGIHAVAVATSKKAWGGLVVV